MASAPLLYRASLVLPISAPPIVDGGVLVANGRIIETGSWSESLRRRAACPVRDLGDVVLLPPLVNAHTHLELSHLAFLGKSDGVESFTQWIGSLLAARSASRAGEEEIVAAGRRQLAAMEESGIGLVGDIGNSGFGRRLGERYRGIHCFFHEKLGLSGRAARRVLFGLDSRSPQQVVTAHAPYSCHARLITGLKERCRRLGHTFSLHVAETAAELRLLRSGDGEFRDFFEKHGFWDDSFQIPGIDINGSVRYLDRLGVLDAGTLCVHGVHVDDGEAAILAARGARVCLCPGSNRFLGVGTAPADRYLRHNILPALGTDSAASNPRLSLWREMRILREEHPGIPPSTILAMATRGGAEALGYADRLGSLSPGKSATMLAIPVDTGLGPGEITEFLVCGDTRVRPRWIR